MKKVLSLVLAFAMILGSFGFVFASEFPDVEDGKYYSEPINVLSGLDVITGFPDGTFGPTKEVTRAQMATMIVNSLGMTVSGQSDTKFSDVPKSHWASGFIAYATSVGFVAGYPDGTFKPDQQVTYDQALTMIVAALGYSAESLPGTWPGSFVNKAQGLGILDICKTTGSANAPRQDVACFLYKALTQSIGYTDKDGAFHTNIGSDGGNDTMIKRLGAVPYNSGNPFVVDGTEKSEVNLDSYFGAYITAYASKDDKTDIIAVAEVMSEFIEGKVNTAKTAIGDYKITSATKPVSFVYFENGEIGTKAYNATTGKNMIFAVKLNGAKIEEVYSAQEWTAVATFRAGSDIQEELEDNQKLDGTYTFVLNDDDEIDESEFIMVGKTNLKDLAEDDIVTVYLEKVTTGNVAKLEVSTEKVEGEITKINKTGDKYTIGGTTYDVAADALTAAKGLQPEAEGTFFLNYAGEVFDFEVTKDTTKNFAVVLDMGMDVGRYGTNDFYLKAFLADGTEKEFAADDSSLKTFIVDTDSDSKVDSWTGLAAGDVVEYEIDSDEVLVGLTKLTATKPANGEFDANGVISGTKVTDKTVIFSFTGVAGEEGKAAKYSVLTAADVKGKKYGTLVGGVDSGDFTAIKVTGVEEATKVYAIFVSEDGKDANGKLWTALYDGEVKSLTMDKSLAPATYTTASGATLYTLTFSGDIVKSIAAGGAMNFYTTSPAAKLEVSGNTFKLAGTNFSLAEDAVVYIYDESDEEWTKGKLSNAKYNYMELIGTGSATDEEYDIVLVTKD